MPVAICPNGHATRWRALKGTSMPPICNICGQPNTKARLAKNGVVRNETGQIVACRYEPVPTPPKRETVICPVCGHRRRVPSSAARQYETDVIVHGDGLWWLSPPVAVPAHTWICWHHTLVKDTTEEILGSAA